MLLFTVNETETTADEALPMAQVVKNLPTMQQTQKNAGSNPGSGISPGGGNGNPLQYSCLENPMAREAWWARVHKVSENQTWLSMHVSKLDPRNSELPSNARLHVCPLPLNLGDCLFTSLVQFSSVTQSCLTLWPHGLQHARPPYPSPSPRVYPNSGPLSQWCYPTLTTNLFGWQNTKEMASCQFGGLGFYRLSAPTSCIFYVLECVFLEPGHCGFPGILRSPIYMEKPWVSNLIDSWLSSESIIRISWQPCGRAICNIQPSQVFRWLQSQSLSVRI